MYANQIRERLELLSENQNIPQCYLEEINIFLDLNTSDEEILNEVYGFVQELAELEAVKRVPKEIEEFIIFILTDEVIHNNDKAACALGIMYLQGRCVGFSCDRAVEMFGKAASLGSERGRALLAMCSFFGLGMDKDYDKIEEYLQGAERDALCMFMKGKMFLDDSYPKNDVVEAYFSFCDCKNSINYEDEQLFGAELYECMGDMFRFGYVESIDYCEALRYYFKSKICYYKRVYRGDRFALKGVGALTEKLNEVERLIMASMPENKWV